MPLGQPMEQNSIEWHIARLGMFTSSKLSELFKEGRGKDEYFGKQALEYIRAKAAERNINPVFLQNKEYFKDYLSRISIKSKATEYGHKFESYAADYYSEVTGNICKEVGFIKVDDYFGDSPDRLVITENGEITRAVEIKNPENPKNHSIFLECETSEDLKQANIDYWYQCHGHIYANRVDFCDFVSFDFMSKYPLKIIEVERDSEMIEKTKERIQKGSVVLENILESIQNKNKKNGSYR